MFYNKANRNDRGGMVLSPVEKTLEKVNIVLYS